MKKILMLAFLTLFVSSCGSNSLYESTKGKLKHTYTNVSYYIKYDTRTYEIVLEYDEDHNPVKTEVVGYANVYYFPMNKERPNEIRNEYLVYEFERDFIIYTY